MYEFVWSGKFSTKQLLQLCPQTCPRLQHQSSPWQRGTGQSESSVSAHPGATHPEIIMNVGDRSVAHDTLRLCGPSECACVWMWGAWVRVSSEAHPDWKLGESRVGSGVIHTLPRYRLEAETFNSLLQGCLGSREIWSSFTSLLRGWLCSREIWSFLWSSLQPQFQFLHSPKRTHVGKSSGVSSREFN